MSDEANVLIIEADPTVLVTEADGVVSVVSVESTGTVVPDADDTVVVSTDSEQDVLIVETEPEVQVLVSEPEEATVITSIETGPQGPPGSSGIVVYNFIQSDEDVTYKYYGFVSTEGWRIKRKTLATGIWHVASGVGDYDDAWADRANKEYAYL